MVCQSPKQGRFCGSKLYFIYMLFRDKLKPRPTFTSSISDLTVLIHVAMLLLKMPYTSSSFATSLKKSGTSRVATDEPDSPSLGHLMLLMDLTILLIRHHPCLWKIRHLCNIFFIMCPILLSLLLGTRCR